MAWLVVHCGSCYFTKIGNLGRVRSMSRPKNFDMEDRRYRLAGMPELLTASY